jgi:cyclophilin family peptidyl-prolyl cis-trans isomerase
MMRILVLLAAVFLTVGGLAAAQATSANPKVLMKTTKGDLTIELFRDKAPVTVENFLSYVRDGFYDGTIFHRVIRGFMIQGGGHTADLAEKPAKAPIRNEAANGLKNLRGTISMARESLPNTATCQFFINHVDNPGLDHTANTPNGFGYCVFGKVVGGMDVVDAIAAVPTGTRQGFGDVPRETITIVSVTVIQNP